MKNQIGKTVYGRTAYEGFAKAIGSKLGLSVSVVDGSSACINAAGTIQMPGMNTYQTAAEFAITCGTVVHELAHQFYKSHRLIDPNRDALEHDCLNAVLDVADETWIAEWFNRGGNVRPGELLDNSNFAALRNNWTAYTNWRNTNHAWKVLCVGILGARLNRGLARLKRHTIAQAAQLGVDAKACFRLIRRAKRLKKQDPQPTRKRFAKLLRLAHELADLLKPFGPSTPPAESPLVVALGAGNPVANGPEATAMVGANMAEPAVGTGAGSGESDNPNAQEYDHDAYQILSPSISKVADRIAIDGDGANCTDGLTSGSRIGQAHRLITDGQCLARWDVADHADGVSVSVLLDCSSSMHRQLTECAGISRAFAVGMRQAGAVQSLAFGCKVIESDDFAHVRDLGGTNTHLALEKAIAWLSDRGGKRWIVIITDGAPNNRALTDDACQQALAKGIHILAVGLNCTITMPGTVAVTASDPTHLAIELDAAAREIERI